MQAIRPRRSSVSITFSRKQRDTTLRLDPVIKSKSARRTAKVNERRLYCTSCLHCVGIAIADFLVALVSESNQNGNGESRRKRSMRETERR